VKVEEYIAKDGTCPYKSWFDSLDVHAAVKVAAAKSRMEQGLLSSVRWFRGIGEYKVDWGPGYRIYLAKVGSDLIILYGGGDKSSQQSDIQRAEKLHQEYKDGRKAEQKKLKDEPKKVTSKKKR
jgi:putative addiction module killer protein